MFLVIWTKGLSVKQIKPALGNWMFPVALVMLYGLGLLLVMEASDIQESSGNLWSLLGLSLFILLLVLYVYWHINRSFLYRIADAERQLAQEQASNSSMKDALIAEQTKRLSDTERDLLASRKQYQTLFERTADALMILEDGAFTEGNPACLKLFGCQGLDEFRGVHPSELSPPVQADGSSSKEKAEEMIHHAMVHGSHRFEWLHQTRQGEAFPAEVLLTAIDRQGGVALCAIVRDITERKKAEQEIRHQAYYDSLTGLPNRRLMLDRISQALISSRRHEYFNALLFVDLDRFKFINDSLGHSVGDALLKQVADTLRQVVREEDTVARFGGDEFVILFKHLGMEKDAASLRAERLAEDLQQSISSTYTIEHHSIHVSSSIGIYLFPGQEETLDDIIKQADTAMYSAKESGRNQIAFFQSTMQEAVVKRLTLEKDLRQAVNDRQLQVYFQPQISSDNMLAGVEALVRWQHPEHGFVSPEEFIAIAEDSGIIYALGEFVLRTSIEQIMALPERPPKLSVNISPYEFRHSHFLETISGLIRQYQLPDRFLVLEITEGVVINDLENTIERLQQLRALGVMVSLDDFGTGYSSLSYLKRLPIDELKIDRSFVMDVEDDEHNAMLVRTIINIAHQFNLITVAEGVETETQKNFLSQLQCRVYQGYLYSRPVPVEELQRYIACFE